MKLFIKWKLLSHSMFTHYKVHFREYLDIRSEINDYNENMESLTVSFLF